METNTFFFFKQRKHFSCSEEGYSCFTVIRLQMWECGCAVFCFLFLGCGGDAACTKIGGGEVVLWSRGQVVEIPCETSFLLAEWSTGGRRGAAEINPWLLTAPLRNLQAACSALLSAGDSPVFTMPPSLSVSSFSLLPAPMCSSPLSFQFQFVSVNPRFLEMLYSLAETNKC